MNWTDVSAGTINAATQRFWVALGDEADLVANRMKNDSDFVSQVALFARNGGFQSSTSQKCARDIMGRNFFGIEEAIRYFGVNPKKTELATLSEVPFTEEVLESVKDTHVLVVVFPMSILGVRVKVKDESGRLFYDQSWYNKESFAKDKGEVGWQLVRKVPIADSTNKTWNEQQALLGNIEETPKAQVVVYTIIGHFLATGERLFGNGYVRTSSVALDGMHVYVGYFDQLGLRVHNWRDGLVGDFGVSSARKS